MSNKQDELYCWPDYGNVEAATEVEAKKLFAAKQIQPEPTTESITMNVENNNISENIN